MSKSTIISPRFTVISATIILAAFSRLVPHWPNVTPIAAIALFGGAYYGRKYLAFLVPLAALFLSDLILGLHASMWAVYSGFIITVIMGLSLNGRVRPLSLLTVVISSSAVFFLLTNFGSWISSPFYSKDLPGLMLAYTAGLPFFLNSLLGDLFYSGVLFGSYYLLQQRFPALQESKIRI